MLPERHECVSLHVCHVSLCKWVCWQGQGGGEAGPHPHACALANSVFFSRLVVQNGAPSDLQI